MSMKKNEGAEMQNGTVQINWRTFNIPNLVAIVTLGIGAITYMNKLDSRIASVEEYRVTRSSVTDKKFEEIQRTIEPLSNVPYRVGVLEQQTAATNARIDRFTEIISTNLDLLRKDVAGLSTRVEVLSQKIDSLTPEKRAELDLTPPSLVSR